MITKILTKSLFFISIIGIVSCSNNQSTKLQDETTTEDVYSSPQTFSKWEEFDENFYLDDLIRIHKPISDDHIEYVNDYINWLIQDIDKYMLVHCEDSEQTFRSIQNLANKLQRFKDGNLKYFPIVEFKDALGTILFKIAREEGHGNGNTQACLVFLRLLEIGAYICPDINIMATHCSEDKKIGIVQLESGYNDYFIFRAIISSTDYGHYEICYLPKDCFGEKFNKFRRIGQNDRNLYLLSNEDNTLNDLYLITLHKDGDVQDIIDLNTETLYHWVANPPTINDLKIYFNPNELSWSYCKKNSFGNLEKIEGTQSLYLNIYDLDDNPLRIE